MPAIKRGTDQHRHITALEELEEIGHQERNIEAQEKRKESPRLPLAPAPGVAHDDVVEDRGDRHGSGDGDSVGRGQSHRLAKRQHQRETADREQVIDLRDIDLPFGVISRVLDGHPGKIAEQHRLAGQRECPGDQGLGGNHGGGTREQDQQVSGYARRHQGVEGVLHGLRMAEDQRTLPQVAQHERGQDEKCPCQPNGPDPKMAHVRVQGLAARHGQDDRAEDEQAVDSMAEEKGSPMMR